MTHLIMAHSAHLTIFPQAQLIFMIVGICTMKTYLNQSSTLEYEKIGSKNAARGAKEI